jgi:hypothetical protein
MRLFKRRTIDRCRSPYLVRYILLESRFGRVMVHRFLRGDEDDEFHCHPWNFTSVILRGGYFEFTPEGFRWYGAGSVLRRPAEWKHRVVIHPGRRVWSLVITGPRVRDWGFWAGEQFTPWRKFVAALRCD